MSHPSKPTSSRSGGKSIGSFLAGNSVPIMFILICAVCIPISGFSVPYLFNEILSRLGRNYLQTGHLIEDFFPRHGVRYIALNDNIDTLVDSNEIAPFKNVLNEMLSLRRDHYIAAPAERV